MNQDQRERDPEELVEMGSLLQPGPKVTVKEEPDPILGPDRGIRSLCTRQVLKKRLPFLQWAPSYNLRTAMGDLLAGTTVALTAIPQGIAYAAVAGLPLEYGLYSAFVGPIVYALLGTVKQVTVGPTAVMAVMTHQYAAKSGPPYALILSFITGLEILLAGLLRLGFLVEFISGPVISGFCSAAAVMICLVQLKSLLGLKFAGTSVISVVYGIFDNIRDIRPWDALLGVSSIVLLVLLKNLSTWKCSSCCRRSSLVSKASWLASVSRNALVVFAGCLLAYGLELAQLTPFTLTGYAKSGLPPFALPAFSIQRPEHTEDVALLAGANVTMETIGFSSICAEIGTGFLLVPLIAVLEHVAIAKAFGAGRKTDCTQEMIALGLGTFAGSFVGSMPITASFGRSSVQSSSGANTPFANFFNGMIVLLALGMAMPALAYIPKAILASVIICAVFPMIEVHELRPMWRASRVDLVPFVVTFLCCVFLNMEYGILIGAAVHLSIFAYQTSRPAITVAEFEVGDLNGQSLRVESSGTLHFPSAEKLRATVGRTILRDPPGSVVLDLRNVTHMDYTTLKVMKSLVKDAAGQGPLHFTNVPKTLEEQLKTILSQNYRLI